jgi:hypothetical protein
MSFIQICEMRTSRFDEVRILEDEWRAATEGKRTVRRVIVGRDREDPERHLVIVFFDSYDSAMQNSNLPETTEFGKKQGALLSAPMTFSDLDVIYERED